ncbi:MAG: twin transmembrane helix small protein [Alphaproteobacteria bacterium]|nr:twin transmembrane helix small protein [Alphaproteobacteria bacterium]OJV16029.1 MAG: hypoxia-induced family protein [Alphaproteobacteria bacterium 33-17]
MSLLPLVLFVAMLLTLIALIAGIVLMARGGKINQKYSNKLMTMRVVLQGLAIAIVAIIFLVAKKSQ